MWRPVPRKPPPATGRSSACRTGASPAGPPAARRATSGCAYFAASTGALACRGRACPSSASTAASPPPGPETPSTSARAGARASSRWPAEAWPHSSWARPRDCRQLARARVRSCQAPGPARCRPRCRPLAAGRHAAAAARGVAASCPRPPCSTGAWAAAGTWPGAPGARASRSSGARASPRPQAPNVASVGWQARPPWSQGRSLVLLLLLRCRKQQRSWFGC
mmetsp:Transcript_23726/g.74680  ORF Transcript_23726/g.74680 Transcript_23726/m.74680 type:complete len:222 (+) Transcript_23726:1357-2022(+)